MSLEQADQHDEGELSPESTEIEAQLRRNMEYIMNAAVYYGGSVNFAALYESMIGKNFDPSNQRCSDLARAFSQLVQNGILIEAPLNSCQERLGPFHRGYVVNPKRAPKK